GPGIDCSISGSTATGDCQETFSYNSTITLNATPMVGSTFTGWGGACLGSGECTVTLTGSLTVSAGFDTPSPPSIFGLGTRIGDCAGTGSTSVDFSFSYSDLNGNVTAAGTPILLTWQFLPSGEISGPAEWAVGNNSGTG